MFFSNFLGGAWDYIFNKKILGRPGAGSHFLFPEKIGVLVGSRPKLFTKNSGGRGIPHGFFGPKSGEGVGRSHFFFAKKGPVRRAGIFDMPDPRIPNIRIYSVFALTL